MRLLIVAMLVACSSPARWKPPELAETTRIQDDLLVRYEPDNTISVTARVAIGSVSASGFVFLRTGDLATAAQSKHVRLARARAWQTLAAILASAPPSAFDAAKKGIDEIVISGLNHGSEAVKRAELARASNNMPEAARVMMLALREYLRGYVATFHADVR